LVDLTLAVLLLYLGVWVYELANLASLNLVGFHSTLSLSGVLPSGVLGLSNFQGGIVAAKPLQVMMSVGVLLPLLRLTRNHDLPATELAVIGMISAYFATAFWEDLSISWISTTLVGQAFFAGIDAATMFMLVFASQRMARPPIPRR